MQSTDSVTLSFDAWLESLRDVCGSFDSTPLSRLNFQGNVTTRSAGGIEIAGIQTNAERIVHHRPSHAADEGDCFLIVQKQGSASLVQDGRTITMRPGEMTLMDSAVASQIHPHGFMEHDSLHLPREEVMRRFGHRHVPFMKVATDSASGQILQMIVSRLLSDQLTAPAEEEYSAIADSLIALLPAIHRHQSTTTHPPDDANEALYRCVQQYIDHHLHEVEVTPESLAGKFHVSVRQLYRLFEQHDESICRHIQRKRLERCAEALANPSHACQTITSIAFQWGFTDSAHFSRAFKRQFARSPREYRRQHLIVTA